jgi:hypothetical protein
LQFDVALAEDDADLRRILRENPMAGEIQVTLEREPSIFLAGTIEGENHRIVVARDEASGRILGMGSRSVRTACVNGHPLRLGYLSQLRTASSLRGRRQLLTGGYALVRQLHEDSQAPFYFTTIVADNRPARRLLEAGLEGLPSYRSLEPFVTLILPVTRKRGPVGTGLTLQRGDESNLPEIVDCLQRNARRHQFASYWRAEDLLSHERTRGLGLDGLFLASRDDTVVGCIALWDQSECKQTVVRGYSRRLRILRPLLNLSAPWIGRPRLPAQGGALRNAFISHVAIDVDDPEVFLELLTAAYNQSVVHRYDYLMLGFAERNPLAAAVKQAFPYREYLSILYLVYWDDGAEAVSAVDSRIPHPEVATL